MHGHWLLPALLGTMSLMMNTTTINCCNGMNRYFGLRNLIFIGDGLWGGSMSAFGILSGFRDSWPYRDTSATLSCPDLWGVHQQTMEAYFDLLINKIQDRLPSHSGINYRILTSRIAKAYSMFPRKAWVATCPSPTNCRIDPELMLHSTTVGWHAYSSQWPWWSIIDLYCSNTNHVI